MTKHTLTTVASSLRDLADVLDAMTPVEATRTARTTHVQKAPEGGFVAVIGGQAAPEGEKACVSCAKPMLRVGVTCKTCLRAAKKGAQKAPEAAPKAAAKVVTTAPAKGRTAADHCKATGCSIFTKKGVPFCAKHALDATVVITPKVDGTFITLEDGKRGYRVPADLVLALRKAGLEDDLILAAAQAKGVGHKVSRAKGSLA